MKLLNPLIPLILLSLIFIHPFEGGGDFYHHVNTGKQIIEQHTFPFTDIYTHTAQGKPWIAHSWVSGLIFYIIFSVFGTSGISLLTALVGLFTILLLYYYLRLINVSNKISILCCFLTSGLILTRLPNRPEIFTYPLTLSILVTDNLRIKHPKLNWLFPFIILIWTNVYGSSVIFGIILIFILTLKQLLMDRTKFQKSQTFFYLCGFLSVISAFINPNTWRSVFYVYIYIPQVAEYEGEWAGISRMLTEMPENYVLLYQYQILIYFIYLSFFLIVAIFSWKKILTNKFLLLLGLSVLLPIFTFRQLPLATILSVPLLGLLLTSLRNKFLNTLAIFCTFIILALILWLKPIGLKTDTSAGDNLVNFLRTNAISGKSFNHYTTGSFLSYYLYPNISVFYDTRDDLYKNSDTLTDLFKASSSPQNIPRLLEKYKIDLIVADIFSDGFNYKEVLNSPAWSIVYFDDRYLIAIPTEITRSKNLQTLDAIDPFSPTGAKPGQEAQAETYYRSISKTPSNQLLLVQTLLAQNKTLEAISILNDLSLPNDLTKVLLQKQQDYFLLKSYLSVSDCKGAKSTLERLEDEVQNNFIFNWNKTLPLIDEDLKALYYKRCTNDLEKANDYMKKYLNRPDINPKEKIKFQTLYQSN